MFTYKLVFLVKLGGSNYYYNIHTIDVAAEGSSAKADESFVGYMTNFYLNRYDFFRYLTEDPPDEISISGGTVVTNVTPFPVQAITITNKRDGYVGLPILSVSDGMELEFMFKTRQKNGILLYSLGDGGDYLVMELDDGYLQMFINVGGGVRSLFPNTPGPLNDNDWHQVKLHRTGSNELTLTVDGAASSKVTFDRSLDRLILSSKLFVGGIPQRMYEDKPAAVTSKNGILGCIASFRINGHLYDLIKDSQVKPKYILSGCHGNNNLYS